MMKYRNTIAAVGVAMALVSGACSSSTSDSGASTTEAGATTSTTATGNSPGSGSATPDTTLATTTTMGESAIVGTDLITQTTPTSGGGTRPLLEWDSVDGAALYYVTVHTDSGSPYWAAVTVETKTYVGGPLQIPAGRTGPNVASGYTWVVYAEDAEGNLLAASPRRAIAP